jgi:hypothetical protein
MFLAYLGLSRILGAVLSMVDIGTQLWLILVSSPWEIACHITPRPTEAQDVLISTVRYQIARVGHLTPRNCGIGGCDLVRDVAHCFPNDDEFSFDGSQQKIVPSEFLERHISHVKLNALDGPDHVLNEESPPPG